MNEVLAYLWHLSYLIVTTPLTQESIALVMKFVPFVLFLEMPTYVVIFLGLARYTVRGLWQGPKAKSHPAVSCIVTCYGEGASVQTTIRSLAGQIYPGHIQIVAMIDGAEINRETHEAACAMVPFVASKRERSLLVVPKWQRGGRVSSLNAGLNFVTGEIVMALDGDTSFDNNMVERATRHFADPRVAAVAGCLRVRNVRESVTTRLQAIEYFLSIQVAKTGLSEFDLVGNISGAFGVFRRKALDLICGWDAGTAEDLDLTMRLKNYLGREKGRMRLVFEPEAIGFTDVPATFRGFLKQRLRWDGDLSYIYCRKHRKTFAPGIIGWPNFIFTLLTGMVLQLVMPLLILVYTAYVLIAMSFVQAFTLLALTYLFYLALTCVIWFASIFLVSERILEDLKLSPWLSLLPFFNYASRLNSCFATLWELLARGHEDTSMAPWWVTKKSRF